MTGGVVPSNEARGRIKRMVALLEQGSMTPKELMAEIPGLTTTVLSNARWRGVIVLHGDRYALPTKAGVPREILQAASVWQYADRCGHESGAGDRGADADDRWVALAGGA